MPCLLNVKKLRVRARERDLLTWRRRVERVLDDTEVPSLRRFPTAVFCVRSLRQRMRGMTAAGPSTTAAASLAGTLDELFRTAARPARGFVPANAEAVVFADGAELLVCLAGDYLQGAMVTRWWWETLFPGRTLAEAVAQAWTEAPDQAPAALAQLDGAERSGEFLQALPIATVGSILRNVSRVFALEQLREQLTPAVVQDQAWNSIGDNRPGVTAPSTSQATNSPSHHQTVCLPPWSSWVHTRPGLLPEAQTLLLLSILLMRAPAVVRSLGFLRSVRDLAARGDFSSAERNPTEQHVRKRADMSSLDGGKSLSPSVSVVASEGELASYQPGGLAGQGFELPFSSPGTGVAGEMPPPLPANGSSLPTPGSTGEISLAVAGQPNDRENLHGSLLAVNGKSALADPKPKAPKPIVRARPDGSAAEVHSTQWAGIFYLINVALGLELYADFTRPRQASLPLLLWDFLALLGRRLIGPPFMEDSCWGILARLSGRATDEPPGAWFEPPEEWRLPASWLVPFPERNGWRGGSANGRARLEHPAGFYVLDAPGDLLDPAFGFRHECDRFDLAPESVNGLHRSDEENNNLPKLDDWVNRLARYIECRLSRSLNEPDIERLRDLVFQHAAQVQVTSERVTIQFSLAAHPIALRLVGLDRDPGWVPAAGRTIAYQYD